MGLLSRTSESYKQLSVNEFTKAADKYETDEAGVYNICKKDYPDILAEVMKEPFEELLDAGCGTTPMVSLLAKQFPNAPCGEGFEKTGGSTEQIIRGNVVSLHSKTT